MQLVNNKATNLQDLIDSNRNKQVSVTYPDGKGNHAATVSSIAEKFRGETLDWRLTFFRELIDRGYSRSNFGEYTLQS